MNLINGNSQADEPIIGAFLIFALIVHKCGEKNSVIKSTILGYSNIIYIVPRNKMLR